MTMNDSWCVDQEVSVIQWNLDFIQCGSWETRSRDQFVDPRCLFDDLIDQC